MECRHWEQMFNKCPFCGDDYFHAGPKGCLSQNFQCRNCGATFNDMGPFGIDLLAAPDPVELLESLSTGA